MAGSILTYFGSQSCVRVAGSYTSCSSERSFSELRLVKTYLRSTMAEERLSSLAIIFCNKDLRVNTEKVISNFARSSARRVEFLF